MIILVPARFSFPINEATHRTASRSILSAAATHKRRFRRALVQRT